LSFHSEEASAKKLSLFVQKQILRCARDDIESPLQHSDVGEISTFVHCHSEERSDEESAVRLMQILHRPG
jgi:hypothetical protein